MRKLRHFDVTLSLHDTFKSTWSQACCSQWHCSIQCSSYGCLWVGLFCSFPACKH